MQFCLDQQLRPWREVAEEYFKRTGEKLSRGRCLQIAQRAEAKIRAAFIGRSSHV